MNYHVPVLLNKCIEGLQITTDNDRDHGTYVDVTFGGGGHSKAILENLDQGKLYGFDQDPDTKSNVPEDPRFHFIEANFKHLKKFLKLEGVLKVDGILADLGISSYQIDQAEKGFSTRFEGPLDMRMDPGMTMTAADVVNEYDEKQLANIFFRYGELRNSRKIASILARDRRSKKFKSTSDLKESIEHLDRRKQAKFLAQVFQALRIEVNDELGALESFLQQSIEVLKPGGRLVVMSYHSLEDRLVKNIMKTGNINGDLEKDFFGNILRPFKQITKKPIVADEKETEVNKRARSAKLRIAERIEQ